MNAATPPDGPGFWRRTQAMLIKEFIQLRRDRVSFAMIVMIPLMQLILFGYAINTTPRDLPTAVLLQEHSDIGRTILKALQNTNYFKVTHQVEDAEEFDRLLASGTVLFGIEIPRGFERDAAARRQAGSAGRGRCHRSGGVGIGARARSGNWCARRCRTSAACRKQASPCSNSAPMPATIRRPRPRSTSCRAWSAPSSP